MVCPTGTRAPEHQQWATTYALAMYVVTQTPQPQTISGPISAGLRVRAVRTGVRPHCSLRSMRAGFVTEAKNRGIDEADIMRHTRHKSVQIMRRYDRTSGLWIRNATTGVSL